MLQSVLQRRAEMMAGVGGLRKTNDYLVDVMEEGVEVGGLKEESNESCGQDTSEAWHFRVTSPWTRQV
jgi:hypothetical protein